ncbi:16730_t:CDS:2 [Entrophospora sp. SA101]|nr:16730_t:CDS:2 [Entrophospora sp. SA101]
MLCWGRYNDNISIKGTCKKCKTSDEVIFEPGLKDPTEPYNNNYCLDCYINYDILEGHKRKPILVKIYGRYNSVIPILGLCWRCRKSDTVKKVKKLEPLIVNEKKFENNNSQFEENKEIERPKKELIKNQEQNFYHDKSLLVQLEEEREKNKILTEKVTKLEKELLRKLKLTELLQTIEKIIREGKEKDYYAQELIKDRKEILKEKEVVLDLEEICRLKEELVKLEIQQNQQFEALLRKQLRNFNNPTYHEYLCVNCINEVGGHARKQREEKEKIKEKNREKERKNNDAPNYFAKGIGKNCDNCQLIAAQKSLKQCNQTFNAEQVKILKEYQAKVQVQKNNNPISPEIKAEINQVIIDNSSPANNQPPSNNNSPSPNQPNSPTAPLPVSQPITNNSNSSYNCSFCKKSFSQDAYHFPNDPNKIFCSDCKPQVELFAQSLARISQGQAVNVDSLNLREDGKTTLKAAQKIYRGEPVDINSLNIDEEDKQGLREFQREIASKKPIPIDKRTIEPKNKKVFFETPPGIAIIVAGAIFSIIIVIYKIRKWRSKKNYYN